MFDYFTEQAVKWLAQRRTIAALDSLSDHDLADIGLSRVSGGVFHVPILGFYGDASYQDFNITTLRFKDQDAMPSFEPAPVQPVIPPSPRSTRRPARIRKAAGARA